MDRIAPLPYFIVALLVFVVPMLWACGGETEHTLTVYASPADGGSVSPATGEYGEDADVTLSASPAEGYAFDCWSGAATGTSDECTIAMGEDLSVTAYFIRQYTLSTDVTPEGAGTVSPAGGDYEEGTRVTVTTVPAEGYVFDHWSGAAMSASDECTVVMDEHASVTAHFIRQYTLGTYVTPDNAGKISPSGGDFEEGTKVTATASPAEGYAFDHWSGAANGTSDKVTVIMDEDQSVTAHFIRLYTLTTDVTPEGAGTMSPAGGDYDEGTQVTVTAVPGEGYVFDSWSGDLTGTADRATVTMNEDRTVTAGFKTISEALSPACEGVGTSQAGSYHGSRHPMVLLDSDGNQHEWFERLPNEWVPVTVEETQFVVCIGEEQKSEVQVCPYQGPDITRYRLSMDVRIVEAETGRAIASTTLQGSMPRACRASESYWLTEISGDSVEFDQLREWLQDYVESAGPLPDDHSNEDSGTSYATVTTSSLPLRDGPDTKYTTIHNARRNDKLSVIGQHDDCTWLKVVAGDGTIGWVLNQSYHLGFSQPCEAVPSGTFRPFTGMVKPNTLVGGQGVLEVENGTGSDGVAILTTLTEQPMMAAYIRDGDTYTLTGIPTGTFYLYFCTGTEWDGAAQRFTEDMSYRRFEDTFTFSLYQGWEVTLHDVPGGTASAEQVDPGQFPDIGD